jgi:sugar transferase EpsL
VLLVIAAPILLLTSLAVWINLGRPVLFRQRRPGWHGDLFEMVKFRTMRDSRDAAGAVRSDAERLTPFGAWLRSTSLDELPELWLVFTGRMSLVGPRPLLPEYLPLYSERQAQRHRVRPGITGLAQVSGRNHLDWSSRLELDAYYAEHVSLRLDVQILARTVGSVLGRRGITQAGEATVQPFRGNHP